MIYVQPILEHVRRRYFAWRRRYPWHADLVDFDTFKVIYAVGAVAGQQRLEQIDGDMRALDRLLDRVELLGNDYPAAQCLLDSAELSGLPMAVSDIRQMLAVLLHTDDANEEITA